MRQRGIDRRSNHFMCVHETCSNTGVDDGLKGVRGSSLYAGIRSESKEGIQ